MEENDLGPLIGRLGQNITDLEEVLNPLIKHALSEKTKQLSLLDRAKIYALIVYTIESLIFSYLRIHGVAATEHPVFRELARVKQYFEKIKVAETGSQKPNMQLDKAAANRFIKHALASNSRGKSPADQSEDTKPSPSDAQGTVTPQKRKPSEVESEGETKSEDAIVSAIEPHEPSGKKGNRKPRHRDTKKKKAKK